MECLFAFVAFLAISSTYGYHPDAIPSEKIKLTSEPRYYPDKKSDNFEKRSLSSDRDEEVTNHADKNETFPSNFYKPHRDYVSFGPSEEDSKYIPHSKMYSKYFIPNKKFVSEEESKKDQTDHEKKSEDIPKYGYLKENHHDHGRKHPSTEHVEDSQERKEHDEGKKPEPFKYGAKYNTKKKEENDEYGDYEKPHNTYSEHSDESRKHIQPKHEEEVIVYYERYPRPDDRKISSFHQENVPYPEHKEPKYPYRKHNYPEHNEEPRYPYENSNYPEHKEEPRYPYENSNYPEHKEEPRYPYENSNYPEHEEVPKIHSKSQHYIEHSEHPKTSLESHYHDYNRIPYERRPQHLNFKQEPENHARSRQYPEYKEEQTSYRGNHPDQDEDRNYKDAEPYPKRNKDKWIEELNEGKSSRASSGFEDSSKYKEHRKEKAPYEPFVEEFVKEHKIDSHKYHHLPSDEPHHKEEKHQGPSLLKHDFHADKYHKQGLFPSFMNFKPNYNFGGLRHGSVYKPKMDIYQELRKDLDIKMRLLKEHEEKLAELQKGHLEKYRSLFEPDHVKKFLDLEHPKHAIPSIDSKYDTQIEPEKKNYGPVETHHKSKSEYDEYPKESNYSYHEREPHPHASRHDEENYPSSKHGNKNYEPKHNHDHHHHHKKDYTP